MAYVFCFGNFSSFFSSSLFFFIFVSKAKMKFIYFMIWLQFHGTEVFIYRVFENEEIFWAINYINDITITDKTIRKTRQMLTHISHTRTWRKSKKGKKKKMNRKKKSLHTHPVCSCMDSEPIWFHFWMKWRRNGMPRENRKHSVANESITCTQTEIDQRVKRLWINNNVQTAHHSRLVTCVAGCLVFVYLLQEIREMCFGLAAFFSGRLV